ncbi:hypothetical protein BATDEDRAFT_26756 [Batrachochytrium dendrobatidis JAM81]|uniref:Uncharacterized protein n=1 Tax=Batrachochytrium dendrobatidis (strain JAM81 / FGSC 10211) TaxID=684364 RepID=F4P8V9_BATDJ|nr:uncharacterized protein BATDEDRAFT_26756 [Batrachochytrium dendrobatidis JAM81]EGF78234.1 hypothetical protein BATDEDRAFT_26756 [Batrachochytrium dendrobatidis JAM81]|eukprot:XP_006681042.1 hypothetical protein BATDEDRAFT_26756 [Batrachochytrium dendrobatidis JAM81]
MKFISTIVFSLLSVTVSAVVIDRPSASESESVKECSTHMQQHTGICASTGTEQQSTETNHDVAQSTVDPDDSDSSVEQSDESSSYSQSKQSDDDIFDNTLYDDICHLPKNYIPENKRPFSHLSKGWIKKLRLGRLWMCRKLALEPLEEESIRVVSEPTPELKSILKTGSTFKPHGSKHDHSKKHQQKSSHDAGSREAKVHFVPTTKIARYSSESSVLQEYDLQLLPPESRFDRFKRQMLRFIGYRRHT